MKVGQPSLRLIFSLSDKDFRRGEIEGGNGTRETNTSCKVSWDGNGFLTSKKKTCISQKLWNQSMESWYHLKTGWFFVVPRGNVPISTLDGNFRSWASRQSLHLCESGEDETFREVYDGNIGGLGGYMYIHIYIHVDVQIKIPLMGVRHQ